jgi:hypothetical protein
VFNNVYKSTGVYYFPTPHEVFASGLWSKLSAPAQALYPWLHCLLWDEKDGDKSMMLTAEDIKAGTGIKSTNSVTKAREDLESHGLIRAIRQKGGYIYEPLNPLSKKRLETIEDFDKLDTEWIQAYFTHHAADWGMFEHKDQPGVFMAHCPFHDAKERNKTLMMNTSDGGFWKCIDTGCGRKGKLVQFEMALWEQRKSKITLSQAWSNVMSIMHSAKREQARIQAEDERIEAERIAAIGP